MGGSISSIYYNKEYNYFLQKQNLKSELIILSEKNKIIKQNKKKRRDTPYVFHFVQSPTRNYKNRFDKCLKLRYSNNS